MGNSVDLQAVSIDPVKPTLKKGTQTTVVANMKNNGPDIIPKGEAKVHVTINGRFLYKPSSFRSDRWKLEAIQTLNGNYELYCVNSKAMPLNEQDNVFKFSVKGKAAGKADINLASTLSATSQSSETDGNNNSVSTEIIVVK